MSGFQNLCPSLVMIVCVSVAVWGVKVLKIFRTSYVNDPPTLSSMLTANLPCAGHGCLLRGGDVAGGGGGVRGVLARPDLAVGAVPLLVAAR